MKTLSLKVPASLNERLERLAKETARSKSMIVRIAIEDYERRAGRGEAKSFLKEARDLAGCVEAPSDLSTSRRHLRGYGR